MSDEKIEKIMEENIYLAQELKKAIGNFYIIKYMTIFIGILLIIIMLILMEWV